MTNLVLLHGVPGDGALWQPVVAALPAETRVHTPTLRWCGPRAWHNDEHLFGTEAHTSQLGKIVDALDQPVAIAAWSYACHVVLNLLLRSPRNVTRVFLYEPGLSSYIASADDLADFNADAAAAFGPVADALRVSGTEAALKELFAASGGKGFFESLPKDRQVRYLSSGRTVPLLLGGGQPPSMITPACLASIRTPVEVAFGAFTRPLFALASQSVARAVPGALLRKVKGADHMLPEKNPRSFALRLTDWLNS